MGSCWQVCDCLEGLGDGSGPELGSKTSVLTQVILNSGEEKGTC